MRGDKAIGGEEQVREHSCGRKEAGVQWQSIPGEGGEERGGRERTRARFEAESEQRASSLRSRLCLLLVPIPSSIGRIRETRGGLLAHRIILR